MLCNDGKISLYCFSGTIVPFCCLLFFNTPYNFLFQFWGSYFWVPILYYLFVNLVIKAVYNGRAYQVAIRAAFLGFVFGLGVLVMFASPDHIKMFGVYTCVMSFFHYSEFLSIAYIQPKQVSLDSFILNHSLQYTVAAISSWCEFFLESYFFPEFKTLFWISYVGLVMCIVGEVLRKAAMLTAHSNFNHLVQCEKADNHVLITHGVYSWCRHPSYVGWFYWSIGTQIILVNPFCIIAYPLAGWYFFKERIAIEEIMLLNFFGQQYYDYQQNVGTGLPFIDGYKM